MRNMEGWKETDNLIKECLHEAAGQIEVSDSLKQRIDSRLLKERKQEENMKHFSIKKVVIAAAIACLTVGTVCVAGSGLKYSLSGKPLSPVYEKFSDLEKAESKAGIQIDAVEKFSNGYAFRNMRVEEVQYMNEAGKQEESRNSIWINYYDNAGEHIYITAQRPSTSELEVRNSPDRRKPDQILRCGDITLEFTSTQYKFVPPDYELTEEDMANMERDGYEISFGSSEVEYNQNYSVTWMKDGIIYCAGGMDLTISPENMLNMAKEIIESTVK